MLLKRLFPVKYPRTVGTTLKENIMHELKFMDIKYHNIPENIKEEIIDSNLKRLHWRIIKYFFIKLIKKMRALRQELDWMEEDCVGEPPPEDLLELNETDKMDVLFNCFSREREKLQVGKRDIRNDDKKWYDLDVLLREISVQLWDIQFNNYIDLQRQYWRYDVDEEL